MSEQSCDIEVRVRYAETDPMGYLHHSRYAVLMEMGRTELLRRSGVAYRDLEAAGTLLVVTKLSISFKSPACYDDVLKVTTRIDRMTTARIDHAYRIECSRTGRLIAEAATTLACVDRGGNVIAITDDLRGRMGP